MTTADNSLKLCFVRNGWAWFTSAPLSLQWGDNWDDTPFEYSAGEPYDFHKPKNKKETKHTIIRVAFESEYVTPDLSDSKKKWSVKLINGGAAPWLSASPWSETKLKAIYAGLSLDAFIKLIRDTGGEVYVPAP